MKIILSKYLLTNILGLNYFSCYAYIRLSCEISKATQMFFDWPVSKNR